MKCAKQVKKWKLQSILAIVLMVFLMSAVVPTQANAKDLGIDVIGPHEYALPVNYDSFNVFVQYVFWNDNSKGDGTVADSDSDTWVGMSKYVRFFTLDALPNVGIAYEVIQPSVYVVDNDADDSTTGLGDTLTGPAIWYKPSENSTIGLQSFVQVPVGDDNLSTNSWRSLTSLFFDWQINKWDIGGNTGFIAATNSKKDGVETEQGTLYHANLRVGYRASQMFEPFVAWDWATTNSGKVKSGPNAGDKIASSDEMAVGAGLMVHFSPTISMTARYTRAVDARNVTEADGVHFKFAYVW